MAPLVGSSMLELGNKRKGDFIYKKFFENAGFRHVSVDTNGLDGALPLDLRKPLNLGTFDMVTNIGTTEHVSEDNFAGQVVCWWNICTAMHVGSVLASITPAKGSYPNHGTWYPLPAFFEELAEKNGMELERVYEDEHGIDRVNNLLYARLRRVADVPFVMPNGGMYENRRRR